MPVPSLQRYAKNERLAGHVGFWWGLAEGFFFFIVPDVYITFATLFAPRAGAVAWVASIAGSLAGVVVVWGLTHGLGVDYLAFLTHLPGISGRLVDHVGRSIADHGLPYTPFLALAGVPLKVYSGQAFSLGSSLGEVLLWTVFARLVRIAPSFIAVGLLRLPFRRRIEARPVAWVAALGLFWVVFYVFYFWRMSRL